MSVWLTIPSKRSQEEADACLMEWIKKGYKVAIWVDGAANFTEWNEHGVNLRVQQSHYPGYATACNALIKLVMQERADAEWFVCAGDDTLPDPNHSAEQIALECKTWCFDHNTGNLPGVTRAIEYCTFGVMQPTGDRWQEGTGGFANAPIDRVAGSPWIGREFARRMYGGAGPYWHEYTHCFVDEELWHVARKLGVYWERRDLIHKHQHWGRGATDKEIVSSQRVPAFLAEANSPGHWRKFKALFTERLAAGFPGHEPIA